VGTQSIVAVLDIKKRSKDDQYEIWTHNGQINTGKSPEDTARKLEGLGAGEIVINSIDQDGLMKGYDFDLVEIIRNATHIPLTVLGGAGSLADLGRLINKYHVIGAAAGSLFVFKGIYRAVLINYPNRIEKKNVSDLCS
jgi:cyclase